MALSVEGLPKGRLDKALSPILGLLLFFQSALVVTGGAVRITGSGLGCPTWPKCTSGSFTPVPHQAQGQLHVWIEFGNRLVTLGLLSVSIIAVVAVLRLKRFDIRALTIGQLVGILLQIPLGGITVLTHLNPIAVASHFILSIILIALGTSLFDRRSPSPRIYPSVRPGVRILSRSHLTLTALVIAVGTVVTGSGPNAGDSSAPRFHIHIQFIAWLHADLVIGLVVLTGIMLVVTSQYPSLRRRIAIFGVVALAQGAIGFLQYYQGLPELLVGAHLLGVTLIWISAWRIHLATK
ncbi:MAG TPA: COX15/CtaA family protein [Candidatus Nanopelagicaceae bacterium]|jgi:cytochrome c oxidase assembly protein subunit 15